MKKTLLLVVLVMISVFSTTAQEVCASPEDESIDLNSITKCTIKPSKNSKDKKTRQIIVKVSARKRYLKKREPIKKRAASSVGSISSAGVSKIDATPSIKNEKIKTKSVSLKNNIESLKEKLSKEEVRKASRFTSVDKIPSFNTCIDAKKEDRMNCFNTEMIKHIQKYFRYPSEAVRDQIQGEVWVRFIIDKNGYVRNIKTLGPKNGEILNEEAKRVVTKLSRFKPARREGERVSVKYGFPINFSLEE